MSVASTKYSQKKKYCMYQFLPKRNKTKMKTKREKKKEKNRRNISPIVYMFYLFSVAIEAYFGRRGFHVLLIHLRYSF